VVLEYFLIILCTAKARMPLKYHTHCSWFHFLLEKGQSHAVCKKRLHGLDKVAMALCLQRPTTQIQAQALNKYFQSTHNSEEWYIDVFQWTAWVRDTSLLKWLLYIKRCSSLKHYTLLTAFVIFLSSVMADAEEWWHAKKRFGTKHVIS